MSVRAVVQRGKRNEGSQSVLQATKTSLMLDFIKKKGKIEAIGM